MEFKLTPSFPGENQQLPSHQWNPCVNNQSACFHSKYLLIQNNTTIHVCPLPSITQTPLNIHLLHINSDDQVFWSCLWMCHLCPINILSKSQRRVSSEWTNLKIKVLKSERTRDRENHPILIPTNRSFLTEHNNPHHSQTMSGESTFLFRETINESIVCTPIEREREIAISKLLKQTIKIGFKFV